MGKMILNGKEYAGSGSEWHEYSTDEKIVGKWIDGKPLYEKTVTFNSVSAGTTLNIPSGVTTVDTLIDVDVMCSISGGFMKVPVALLSVQAEWGIAEQQFTKSTGYLRVDFGSERSVTGGFAIFRYTKTTD